MFPLFPRGPRFNGCLAFVEELIDEEHDGFYKFINNGSAVPLLLPTADKSVAAAAEFLSFTQHVQFYKTKGMVYLSDLQDQRPPSRQTSCPSFQSTGEMPKKTNGKQRAAINREAAKRNEAPVVPRLPVDPSLTVDPTFVDSDPESEAGQPEISAPVEIPTASTSLKRKNPDDDDLGRATDCCMQRVLSLQQDFREEKPLLQLIIEKAGHKCLFLPKFHCELNPIEMEDVEDSVRASRRRHGSATQMRAGKGVDARTPEASPHGLRTRGARAAEGEEGSGMMTAKWVERERASL
ncbi:hypothetical protein B0H10DRAFT_2434264 [Mycena sp. CBHHK59/15]|nr:hypothetical protein B0H10DRAFT_2434264 [Mycena sp. CBHHK59/15]